MNSIPLYLKDDSTTLYHGGKELKNATHPLPPFFTFNHELPSANPTRYPPNHSSNLPYLRYRSLFPLPAVSQPQSIWLRCCAVRYELLLLQPLCLQGRLWGMKARANKDKIPLYLLQPTSRVAWSRCDLVHLNGAPHSRYAFDTLFLYSQISRLGQALQALRSSTLVTRSSLNFCLRWFCGRGPGQSGAVRGSRPDADRKHSSPGVRSMVPRVLYDLVHSGCISDRNLFFEGQISLYLNIESAVRSTRVIDVIQYTEYFFFILI